MQCDCGHDAGPSGCGTGYGRDANGRTHCYACCGKLDAEGMAETGRATLYLVGRWPEVRVTNWPDSLSFPVTGRRKGCHNIAGTRYDVWFRGPDGARWWGVNYGEWSQILRCKRIKG